jgi:AraC-like DNA-binding protein
MIGKTRHGGSAKIEEVYDLEVGRARGMLRRTLPEGKLRHVRRRPAADLAPWIAHYWMIQWDLRECEPQVVESLPHPNVHLIFEDGKAVVAGVQTSKFVRTLAGKARVFGVKFKPGGFRTFLGNPVSKLADRIVPARGIFGEEVETLKDIALSKLGEEKRVRAANDFFLARMPQPDPMVRLSCDLVESILQNPEIKTVDDLVKIASLGKRRLQRIFSEHVGASPKWVIRRYRVHELMERFNAGSSLDWAQLALDLGYFDQAHLINDFKAMVGYSPTEYRKRVAGKSRSGKSAPPSRDAGGSAQDLRCARL